MGGAWSDFVVLVTMTIKIFYSVLFYSALYLSFLFGTGLALHIDFQIPDNIDFNNNSSIFIDFNIISYVYW